MNIDTKSRYELQTDPARYKEPFYKLKEDGKKYSSVVRLSEVRQYIKHLKAEQEFNPLVFHHFIIYRPKVVFARKRIKIAS